MTCLVKLSSLLSPASPIGRVRHGEFGERGACSAFDKQRHILPNAATGERGSHAIDHLDYVVSRQSGVALAEPVDHFSDPGLLAHRGQHGRRFARWPQIRTPFNSRPTITNRIFTGAARPAASTPRPADQSVCE